jgi:hypothetical protein
LPPEEPPIAPPPLSTSTSPSLKKKNDSLKKKNQFVMHTRLKGVKSFATTQNHILPALQHLFHIFPIPLVFLLVKFVFDYELKERIVEYVKEAIYSN